MSLGIEGRLDIRKRLKELELERPSRLVKLIERLLADEREKVADHLIKLFRDCMPDFEEIGVCRSGQQGAEWMICFDEAAFRSRIRQLDLTKPESDLALGSTEEEGNG